VPMTQPYRVFVVVDRDYGQRLAELAETGPVWIVDTPANRSVAQEIWAARPNSSHLEGVTTFKVPEGTFIRRHAHQRTGHNRPSITARIR
jgi:hypothetical protein